MPMVDLLLQKINTTRPQFLQLGVCIQGKLHLCKQLFLTHQLLLQEQVQHMKLQLLKAAEMDHQVHRVFSDSSLVEHTLISREVNC